MKQVGWFSFDPEFHVEREQMCCYLTRTTKETHQIVRDNLNETPTYGGWVEAKGPRYCPSIEDKVVYHVAWQSILFLSWQQNLQFSCKELSNIPLRTDVPTILKITKFIVSDCKVQI